MGTVKTKVIFTLPSLPTISLLLQLHTDKIDLLPFQNPIIFVRTSGSQTHAVW